MHPLILYEAVRDEQARRVRQAGLERTVSNSRPSARAAPAAPRRSIPRVGPRWLAAVVRRIDALARGRARAA